MLIIFFCNVDIEESVDLSVFFFGGYEVGGDYVEWFVDFVKIIYFCYLD